MNVRSLKRGVAVWVLVLGGPAHALHAQGSIVQVGDRVRVTGSDTGTAVVGTIIRQSADSLWLAAASGDTLPLAPTSARLERSQGMHGHALTGALIGGAVGTAATLFFLSQFCGGDTLCDGDEQVRAAAVFALPALAAGTIIGALTKSERWEPVVLVGGLAPGSPQLRLGLNLRW